MSIAERVSNRARSSLARAGINMLRASGAYGSYFTLWRLPNLFNFAEERGLHILPVHFYTPIPSQVDLQRKRRSNSLAGVLIDIDTGARAAVDLLTEYASDVQRLINGSAYKANSDALCPLDAAILYCQIRKNRPSRIIEVGSGMSTIVMLTAITDGGLETKVTCIEPYPPEFLKARRHELHEMIEMPLQDVDLSKFESLEQGDILFIDSTHVVRFDSDVVHEILEILPRVKLGVLVHLHDIFLPFDYPQHWLAENRFFWAEQYMLQAFLSMNPHFRVEIPLHAARELVLATIPLLQTNTPVASFWMRRI